MGETLPVSSVAFHSALLDVALFNYLLLNALTKWKVVVWEGAGCIHGNTLQHIISPPGIVLKCIHREMFNNGVLYGGLWHCIKRALVFHRNFNWLFYESILSRLSFVILELLCLNLYHTKWMPRIYTSPNYIYIYSYLFTCIRHINAFNRLRYCLSTTSGFFPTCKKHIVYHQT